MFILFLPLILLSCEFSGSKSGNKLSLDEVSYVTHFPREYKLKNQIPVELPIIGVKNFVIYDSLLIAYTNDSEGMWSIVSLPEYTHLGSFIRRGNGPNEFAQSPSVVTDATFYMDGGTLFAGLLDASKGVLYKVDIANSIRTKQIDMTVMKDSLSLFPFSFVIIDSTTFLCREISYDLTRQNRYLIRNNTKVELNAFEKLNAAHINQGEDYNILSAITKFNREKKMVVEIPIGLNQINMYSIDETFSKTICVGKRIDNIDDIQETSPRNRMYTYADIRLYDKFFGVLRINEDKMTFQTKRCKLPEIQLFDWSGNPLVLIKSNRFITSFDLDFLHGVLYTFDHVTDETFKYDVHDILESLNRTTEVLPI